MKTIILILTSLGLLLAMSYTLTVSTIVLLICVVVLLPVLFYTLAQIDIFFTTVPYGEIRTVSASDNFVKGFENYPGFHFRLAPNGDSRPLEEGEVVKLPILFKTMGIVWIGWIWPFKKVHIFTIDADKLIDQTEQARIESTSVRKLIHHERRKVGTLWKKIPRPVLIQDVELPDGSMIDFVLLIELVVTNAVQAVFVYKSGNILQLIDREIRGAVNDFFSTEGSYKIEDVEFKTPQTYNELLKTPLSHGSAFPQYIMNHVVHNQSSIDHGLVIQSVGLENYSLSEKQKELSEATFQVQVAERKAEAKAREATGLADARRIEADAESEFIQKTGDAEASAFANRVEQLTKLHVDPNQASDNLTSLERGRSLRDSKNLVYSDVGGSGHGVIVDRRNTPDKKEGSEES